MGHAMDSSEVLYDEPEGIFGHSCFYSLRSPTVAIVVAIVENSSTT